MNYKPIKKYFKNIKNIDKNQDLNKIQCNLCPNNCILLNNKYGLCNARININGKLYSAVYGYPCSIQIDPIEKKPLYHYYPQEKILSIGTFGCNMFCQGCQNYIISRAKPQIPTESNNNNTTNELKYYSPKDIIDIALQNNIKLIAYTYNEPTIFFEYMIDIAKLAKKNKIKNVIVSNGFINPKPLKELLKYIDAANIDIKSINKQFYREYCKSNITPVLETIKIITKYNKKAKNRVWLELTNLIIPKLNDSKEDIDKLCNWIINNIGPDIPIHFSKFYPYYHTLDLKSTDNQTLYEAKTIASSNHIKYIYLGNIITDNNTYCNKCNTLLIDRTNYPNSHITKNLVSIKKTSNKLSNNYVCDKCLTVLSGKFKLIN
jgi:pyruvate formate lyase activating enzyme